MRIDFSDYRFRIFGQYILKDFKFSVSIEFRGLNQTHNDRVIACSGSFPAAVSNLSHNNIGAELPFGKIVIGINMGVFAESKKFFSELKNSFS